MSEKPNWIRRLVVIEDIERIVKERELRSGFSIKIGGKHYMVDKATSKIRSKSEEGYRLVEMYEREYLRAKN